MIRDWTGVRIYIQPGRTDMRKQINGLAELVEKELGKDVFAGDLFLFCGSNRRRLKLVYWDKNGFCLWLKRLEKHRFPWPMNEEACKELTMDELRMLLSGIDFFNAHQTIHFSCVS